jgi:hypothetical protein
MSLITRAPVLRLSSNVLYPINTAHGMGIGVTDAEMVAAPAKFYVRKTSQSWLAAIQGLAEVTNSSFIGTTHILAGYLRSKLIISSGQQTQPVLGLSSTAWSELTGAASWGAMGELIGHVANVFTTSTAGTVPNVSCVQAYPSAEAGANDRWTNYFGFRSKLNQYGSGTLVITNAYGFYSDFTKHANTTLTNKWHFYGNGNAPSYFGGDVQIVGALTTNLGLQTKGAADSGGAGFAVVRVPN